MNNETLTPQLEKVATGAGDLKLYDYAGKVNFNDVNIPKTIPSEALKTNLNQTIIPTADKTYDISLNKGLSLSDIVLNETPKVADVDERQNQLKSRTEAINYLLDPEKGESARKLQLEKERGVQEKTEQLSDLNKRLSALNLEEQNYKRIMEEENPLGISGTAGRGVMNKAEKDFAIRKMALASEKTALADDLKLTLELVKNQIDTEFKPQKDRIDYIDKVLKTLSDDLTESQKFSLVTEKEKLATEKKQAEDFQDILDDASKNGASAKEVNEAKKIFLSGDRTSAISLLSNYTKKQVSDNLTPYQKFSATQSIAKATQDRTKNTREISRQVKIMDRAFETLKASKGKDRIGATQAIIFAFNKILDADSVVREGEYDRTGKGQAVIEKLEGSLQNLLSGGNGITDDTLKQLIDTGRIFYDEANQYTIEQNQRAKEMARSFGLNEDFVTTGETKTETSPKQIIKTSAGDIDPNWMDL